jgi:hypothetical protein
MVKRWGVMMLVALLVLGTMGAALADEGDEGVEPEAVEEALEPGSHDFVLEWAGNLVNFVFYWGLADGTVEAQSECQSSEPSPSGFGFFPPPPSGDPVDCLQIDVAGPNGQVNRGSMVSAFVHWLKKDGGLELLSAEYGDMPKGKGQLVRQVAQYDFGNELPEGELTAETEGEEDDGHGPPESVLAKKAAKAEAKANRK